MPRDEPRRAADARVPGLFRSLAHRRSTESALPIEGRLGSFDRAAQWLGSPPLETHSLRGRIVLVDFWTYTCVNWLRTLPYLRAWHAKYADAGLTIVGVHTPEFSFEHDPRNVIERARDLGVHWPVAVDNDFGVWDDFANRYWPAVYLADAEGRIRYHHFGEGEYAMTEMAIQQLLLDSGSAFDADLVSVEPTGLEEPADWATLATAETYLGYARSSGFASDDVDFRDRPHVYDPRDLPDPNEWDLSGDWTITQEAAVLNRAGGRITCAFHARDVNLVVGPPARGAAIPFRVTLDGGPVDGAHGFDVDADGRGTVTRQDTLQLIRQSDRITARVVEIEFLEAGAEAYCFTFG